jgi:adenosine deaminase
MSGFCDNACVRPVDNDAILLLKRFFRILQNMDIPITREFLVKLPKTDLHLHLDGSVRLETLIDLAREIKLKIPSNTAAGLRETVFKDEYANLEEYLTGFGLTCKVMQTPEQLERIAYELAEDNQREGVRYIEVRFAPQLHVHDEFDAIAVLEAVDRGLNRAKRDFNQRPEIRSGAEPPFEYGIIACAMRYFDERFSHFFQKLLSVHRYSDPNEVFGLASLELVAAAARARDDRGLPVVGVDLAGPEEGYPPIRHREAYLEAQRLFLHKTVHAGEAYGPESIFQAITELHADRIGHGTSLFNAAAVSHPSVRDREQYVEKLAQFVADRRITLEVCLTSNMQTNPGLKNLEEHPFGQMMERRLSVTVCTDNRTVSNTTVTDELYKAVHTFELGLKELKNLLVYGFKRSFFPGHYVTKRAYVRRCMEYFEQVEQEFRSQVAGNGNGVS